MEITPERASELLNDPRNLAVSSPTFIKKSNGRTHGAKDIPQSIRTIIGVAAHHDTIVSVADAFNVSKSTVMQSKKGNVGVNRHDEEMKDTIDEIVGKQRKDLREVALERVAGMFASVINDQNLGTLPIRAAVGAAKDLATIVDKLTPKQAGTNVAVFVHPPRVRSEAEYGEVIVVAARPDQKQLT